jgi:AraC-like DNA-binding protein
MPTALICYTEKEHSKELLPLFSSLTGWDIHLHNVQKDNVRKIRTAYRNIDLHFLVYSIHLNQKSLKDLQLIREDNPWTFIIYYNSLLVNQQFLRLSELGVNSCIVGVDRKKYLKEYIQKVWLEHWKRIPDQIYPKSDSVLPPRAKKIKIYLENRPIKDYTVEKISNDLKISQSHFRAEFKQHFGINFREFRQRLFNHYESVLLLSGNYKPADVCKILNYKYMANYSRSFKMRHGESWRNYKNPGDLSN